MKILLINPPIFNMITTMLPEVIDEERGYNPPLGILYIAAYLEKYTDFEIKILDTQVEELNYEQIKERIKKENPDVVGITAMTFTLIDVIKIAKICKTINPKIKIILGGPHVNIYPEETLQIPEIDFVVLGEGEVTAKELIENINKPENLKNIKGIVFKDGLTIINTGKRALINNLDELPFPARHLTPYQKYSSILAENSPVTTMFTSRGCPYKCLFCDRPHLGKIFRARSAKNVVDEMELCQNLGIKEILVYDDTFTIDRQRTIDVCKEYKKRGLTIGWDIRARVNTVDEEVLAELKSANCKRIHYGVEAGTQKILNVLRKGITLQQVKTAFELTKKAGIQTLAYFMIGSPKETEQDIRQTIKFAKSLKPDYVHITITTPFPATDLYYLGLQKGILPYDFWKEFAQNPKEDFKPLLWTENFSVQELYQQLRKAYRSFYYRPSYLLKKLVQIHSLEEFKRKAKAGLGLLKI